MNAQKTISNILTEANGLGVHFHAFFWGKYELVDIVQEGEYSFFARSTSRFLNRRLSFKKDKIFLHREDKAPLFLFEGLDYFLQKAHQFGEHILYDTRPKYQDLFSPKEMFISKYKDPEDFEEVTAYINLLSDLDQHFGGCIGIETIEATQEGNY